MKIISICKNCKKKYEVKDLKDFEKCPLCGKSVVVGIQEFFYDLGIKTNPTF